MEASGQLPSLLPFKSGPARTDKRHSIDFYRRDAVLARVQAMALCLCLVSVTSRYSVERVERIGLVLAWELLFTFPTLCSKEIQVPSKIRLLPSGTLLQTLDVEDFATACRSSKRVINLAREGGRSERDKLRRRRSAKLIIPPSSDARPLVYRTDRQALSTARFCLSDFVSRVK